MTVESHWFSFTDLEFWLFIKSYVKVYFIPFMHLISLFVIDNANKQEGELFISLGGHR